MDSELFGTVSADTLTVLTLPRFTIFIAHYVELTGFIFIKVILTVHHELMKQIFINYTN